MNRKTFIESLGATCRNWYWSWSFVNHAEKFVIFGAWERRENKDGCALILSDTWKKGDNGRLQAGYTQAIEHIGLIKDKGYILKIFMMEYSEDRKDKNGNGPACIKSFSTETFVRKLKYENEQWFAC
ncbi:MAG: hypothetical protein AB7E96_06870 [Deferribacterales bacterium]